MAATLSPSNGYLEDPMVMQSSLEANDVGVAYTTAGQTAGVPASDFDQRYYEQQQAYLRSIQEQQERKAKAEEQAQIIRTLEGSQSSLSVHRSATKPILPPDSLIPAQNRVFGLRKDLAGPSLETAHLDGDARARRQSSQESLSSLADASSSARHSKPSTTSSASNGVGAGQSSPSAPANDGPQFSVEVIAPAFDKRGYPVFSGRGARIRGVLRTKPMQDCEIVIQLTADITQGSPAAVYDGVALMPPEQGTERRVFTVEDRLPLENSMASLRPGADPSSTNPDDYIYIVPFDLNLPLGVSTRFVNGEQTTTAVALPPSYEMSSKNDSRDREAIKANNNLLRSSAASIKSRSSRMTNFSTSAVGIGNSVKEAVEKGLSEVYRTGCFYKIGFTLQKVATAHVDPIKKSRLGKKKKVKEPFTILDKITVPFIFTGEPTSLPPPPHSIPLSLVAPVLLHSSLNLGDRWECERNQAKWSGSFFRTAKRQVQLEMHMPSPAVLQAPCVFPFILIIRPLDPSLLSSIPSTAGMSGDMLDTDTIHQSSRHSRPASISKGSVRTMQPSQDKETLNSNDTATEQDGLLNKFKNSMSLSRKDSQANLKSTQSLASVPNGIESSANSIRGSLASTFARKRPNTAPSGASSSGDNSGTSMIGVGGRYTGNLSGLVRVTLVQTTYCVASGPSEVPKSRRKFISEAELEEVDVESILNETGQTNGHGDQASMEADQALISHVQSKGIRVLKGLIRVSTDATPSFRCKGIEVKYAIKVDLIPFSKKESKRPNSRESMTGTITPTSRLSISLGDMPSSPPLPPFPAEHRRALTSSASTTAGSLYSPQPNYSPSVALGLGVGGTSTVVSENAMYSNRLEKSVGALWADVRMVRSAFAS